MDQHNVHAKYGRLKGKFVSKKRKTWIENVVQAKRARHEAGESWSATTGYVASGRRIVELGTLAEQLWCNACDIPLSLRYLEDESVYGLASVLLIRCKLCLTVYKVLTNKAHVGEEDTGRKKYAVNYKVATAVLDGGSGEAQINVILSALNIPAVTSHLIKRYERKIGVAIEDVAKESCRDAIALEKKLTIEAREQEPTSSHQENDFSTMGEAEPVGLVGSIDAAWQKRGSGRSYNSLTGHSTLIGHRCGGVMSYATRTKRCAKCERGNPKSNHDCRLNFTGSAKAMEPDMAVELVAKNSLLEEANARIGVLIGDDDSSTIAAVRRESSHRIEKWSDLNHAKKGVINALYSLKLTAKLVDYFSHCFGCAVKQNKDDVEGTKNALLSIVPHAFGEHVKCGSWCRYEASETEYVHEGLPNGKPLSAPDLRISLTKVFEKLANNAARLAPCGSTQANESLNNGVCFKHHKDHHYGSSESFAFRVAAAVCQKNIGQQYIVQVHEKLGLSPGAKTKIFRQRKEAQLRRKSTNSKTPQFKRRRLFVKKQRCNKNTTAENREGITYSTECGVNSAADLIQDECTLNERVDLNDATIVIYDLETSGLSNTAEICQIAAVHANQIYDAYILPMRGISPSASIVTGLTIVEGELHLNESRVDTIPPRTALVNFLKYLNDVSENKGVILVAHNGFRFDVPILLRAIREFGLLSEFIQTVRGFADTLPLFRDFLPDRKREKKKFSQGVLANDYLEPSANDGAHNAVQDVTVLKKLIDVIGLTSEHMKNAVKSVGQIIKEQDSASTHAKNRATLEVLKNGVSPGMRSKMAKVGITTDILKQAYREGGDATVKMLLAEDVGGHPRVTKNEKVIKGIIGELVLLCQ